MCGIVGLVGDWPPELLPALNEALRHRGPDDAGEFVDEAAGVRLAASRLAILDLAGGHQPMGDEDALWIVFNGEIFNSPELRASLEARGHRFRTSHSDTECLLRLYADRGEPMLADLNGMFAFVIYDPRRRRLFGARDRLGIKPLYYVRQPGRLAFASELKALLLLPSVAREVDLQSLYHYLSLRYVPGERSIVRDVFRLGPGRCFTYALDTGSLTVRRYWRPDVAPAEQRSEAEWSDAIREELRAAVRRCVLSDVPVGCSLSGGLDSTTIVGLLGEMGYPRIRTYSLGFTGAGEEAFSELRLARQVARRWGTEHHELTLTAETLLEDLLPMVWSLDEPYGGGLPSWYVFRFMSEDVKVGLTGTGGDELFGNYGKWLPYEQSLPGATPSLRRRLRRAAARLPGFLLGARRKGALAEELRSFERPLDGYSLYMGDAIKRQEVVAFTTDGLVDTAAWLQGLYDASGATEIRNGVACVDLETQLPEEFLLMTDRFSMAHSLEARVPLLDHLLVERVLRIPPATRTRPRDLKHLLKRAVGDLLPPELLRAPKRGFVIPDSLWLRGPLRPLAERLLAPQRLARQGLLRPQVFELFVRPHLTGREDFAPQVWTLLMFQLWHLIFVEEAATSVPAFSWRDLASPAPRA